MKKVLFTFLSLIAGLALFAQMKIYPPNLDKPINDALNQMPNVVLDWDAVPGIGMVNYEIQLDTNAAFPTPVTFTTSLSSVQMQSLMFYEDYYWRVRASDNTGTSDWSVVFHFTTFSAVELSKPNNEATEQMPDVLLKWKKTVGSGTNMATIGGVDYFDYQISPDSNFINAQTHTISEALASGTGTNVSFYIVNASELSFDTLYYWRIRAGHSLHMSNWCEAWTFTVIDKPVAIEPANGATGQMLDVQLEWEAITGITGYLYEIDDDPAFPSPVVTPTTVNKVSPVLLDFAKTYYWRVQAIHNVDTSGWSDTWNFQTVNKVTLKAPASGDTITELFPTFEWNALTGIASFDVQYDDDQNFGSPDSASVEGTKSSYKALYKLNNNVFYYWKVRARSNGFVSQWSDVWNFLTPPAVGISEPAIDKPSVTIYPNPGNGNLNISINTSQSIDVKVTVLNLVGQTLLTKDLVFRPGNRVVNLDLTGLQKGIYFVRILKGSDFYSEKLVIQ